MAVNRGPALTTWGRGSPSPDVPTVRRSCNRRPEPEPNEKADAYIIHMTGLDPDPVPMPAMVGPAA